MLVLTLQSLFHVQPLELVDIGLVALLLYTAITSLKRARATLVLAGLLILGGVYVMARYFRLQLTVWILQGFFAVFVIVLIVVFQRDLKQLFEQIAVWSLRRDKSAKASQQACEAVVAALSELARRRIGALIVIAGRDPLDRHLEGGVQLDGRISQPLLLSLFDPNSTGHDGAIVVEANQVSRFSVLLPLSNNFGEIGRRGTRHAAALGLAECTDALCVVVSEERGEISMARNGSLRTVTGPHQVRSALLEFVNEKLPAERGPRAWFRAWRENWADEALALGLAVALWLIFVSGAQVVSEVRQVPVVCDHVPADFVVQSSKPEVVEVTFTGRQRDFYLLDIRKPSIHLDTYLIALGRRTFQINPEDVWRPPDLNVIGVQPQQVTLSVRQLEGTGQVGPNVAGDPSGRRSSTR